MHVSSSNQTFCYPAEKRYESNIRIKHSAILAKKRDILIFDIKGLFGKAFPSASPLASTEVLPNP
jgi:hypothetical protein